MEGGIGALATKVIHLLTEARTVLGAVLYTEVLVQSDPV